MTRSDPSGSRAASWFVLIVILIVVGSFVLAGLR
jgi:hypothetical protein